MTKIHVVDGTFELFRGFYGTPPRRSPDGREVGATRAVLTSMIALLRDEATHVGIAFDHVIESFRNDLFAGYKTGEGIEPALWQQFPLIEEGCGALGVVVWPMVEFEADDALAAAAHKFRRSKAVEQVIICSPDKDLAQCVIGRDVVCLDRIRGNILDEDGVHAKFGIGPKQIPDYLALVGDTADGIPGVPRWGAKSTATVLAHYGHLEDIPAADWDVKVRGAAGLQEQLAAVGDDVFLYRQLATLRTDVPLAQTLKDMKWQGPTDAWEGFCEKVLGDERLAKRAREVAASR